MQNVSNTTLLCIKFGLIQRILKYPNFQLFVFFLQVFLAAYEYEIFIVWKNYFTFLEIIGTFIFTYTASSNSDSHIKS